MIGGSQSKQTQPTRTASAAPPPTETRTEVTQAKRDTRRQAQRKRGMQATILAGETGGFRRQIEENQTSAAGGGKTLLGGGGA